MSYRDSQAPKGAKLILRYTNANQYLSGQVDIALRGIYEGYKWPGNRATKDGIRWHRRFKASTDLNGRLHSVLGGQRIINAVTEQAMRVQLTDNLILEGEPDAYGIMRFVRKNWRTIAEYKTGVTSLSTYMRSDQRFVYQMFYPDAELAMVYHYNQHTDTLRVGSTHLNEHTLKRGVNWFIGIADNIMAERFSQGLPWWNYDGA